MNLYNENDYNESICSYEGKIYEQFSSYVALSDTVKRLNGSDNFMNELL